MAYFYDPSSYANTFYGGPPTFMRRRPSPPPATYYPRETYDPYVRALAEEQAARSALQDAIKREREARQRRAEEEARVQLRRRKGEQERQRLRQRPQTMYSGYAPRYGYPEYGVSYGYPEYGCSPTSHGGYGDMDIDYEDEYPQFTPFYTAPPRRPTRGPVGKQPTSPKRPTSDTDTGNAPKISIPISSPSPKPSKPEASAEEKNAAASKIQLAYRVHHALNAIKTARERFTLLMSTFTFPDTLDFDLSSAPQGDERPKLMYSKNNAPIHAHEDALVRLLQTLDAVESHGDTDVRVQRRELVREVERELEKVDREVRSRYEELTTKAQANAQARTRPSVPEEKEMDEDVEAPVSASAVPSSDEAVARSSESQAQPEAMEVEPPSSTAPEATDATAASETERRGEGHTPLVATNDSGSEAEGDALQMPPRTSVEPPESHSVSATDIGMQEIHPSENVPVRAPDGSTAGTMKLATSAPQQTHHPVTVEEVDDRDDADEVVMTPTRW